MTTWKLVTCLFLTLPLVRAEPSSPFTGKWEGELHGTVYARLIVREGSPLSGLLATGHVDTSDDGTLKDATAVEGDGQPLVRVSIVNGDLVFASDGDHLKLHLIDAATAELLFMDLPPGTKVKPIVLKRK